MKNKGNWNKNDQKPKGIDYGSKVNDPIKAILDDIINDHIKLQDKITESSLKAGSLNYAMQLILNAYAEGLLKRHHKLLRKKGFKLTEKLFNQYFKLADYCQDIQKILSDINSSIRNLKDNDCKSKGDKDNVIRYLESHQSNFGKDYLKECRDAPKLPKICCYLEEFYYVFHNRIEPYLLDPTELNDKLANLTKLMPKLIASEVSLTVQILFTIIPERKMNNKTAEDFKNSLESARQHITDQYNKALELNLQEPIKDILDEGFNNLPAITDANETNVDEIFRQYDEYELLILNCSNLHEVLRSTSETLGDQCLDQVLLNVKDWHKSQKDQGIKVSITDLETKYVEEAFARVP